MSNSFIRFYVGKNNLSVSKVVYCVKDISYGNTWQIRVETHSNRGMWNLMVKSRLHVYVCMRCYGANNISNACNLTKSDSFLQNKFYKKNLKGWITTHGIGEVWKQPSTHSIVFHEEICKTHALKSKHQLKYSFYTHLSNHALHI